MSYAITVRVQMFQQNHDFCLTVFHNRFKRTGDKLQGQLQKLTVSLEASLNINNSFNNLEKLFSVFNS